MLGYIIQAFNVGAWFGADSCQQAARPSPPRLEQPVKKVAVPFRMGRQLTKAEATVANSIEQAAATVAVKVDKARASFNGTVTKLKDKVAVRSKEGQAKHERNIFLHYLQCTQGDLEQRNPESIAVAVKYCARRSKESGITDKEKADIRTFFQEKLATLSEDRFNRRLLLGGEGKLQRIISPELDSLLTQQEQDPELVGNKQHQLEVAVARAQLAIGLGAGTSRAGGCNGAVIVKSLEGKAIGVFKAPPEATGFDPARAVKAFFGQARLFNRQDPMNEPYSEVAMHYFSEVFGLDLAPAATQVMLQDKEGAFLAFLGGYQELEDVQKEFNKRDSFEKDELIKWQTAMVAIFASLNFDPHAGNIFVQMKNGKLEGLKVIDAGNNFAARLPGTYGTKGHRSEPGALAISKKPFEAEVKEFIKSHLTQANLDKFVAKVAAERPDFWTPEMDLLHRRTLDIVRENVVNGKIESPFELLNILTPDQYADQEKVIQRTHEEFEDFVVLDVGDAEAEVVKAAAKPKLEAKPMPASD